MQGTPQCGVLSPFPCLPAIAKYEPVCDFQRLKELIGLEERRAYQGVDDAEGYQIAERMDCLHV